MSEQTDGKVWGVVAKYAAMLVIFAGTIAYVVRVDDRGQQNTAKLMEHDLRLKDSEVKIDKQGNDMTEIKADIKYIAKGIEELKNKR